MGAGRGVLCGWLLCLLQATTLLGRDIYVDVAAGDDGASGLASRPVGGDGPLRTLRPAMKKARPGDTIHLAPREQPYRDILVCRNVRGEPAKPIIFDGHGATITGCDPIDATEWQEVGPGLYRHASLVPERLLTANDALISRWFFVFDGRINHMGRTRKGKSLPLKAPADLAPEQWTYRSGERAFYIKIDPAKRLADCRIEAPLRVDGVQIGGDCAHLVFRNLITTHAYNDGFGLHGKTRDLRFENIQAIECGDDGFSAHDDCEVVVDGFASTGNTSGLANTGASQSTNTRLRLEGNLGTDLLFLGSGVHTITESVLSCSRTYSLRMWGGDGFENVCTLKLDHVRLERGGDTSSLKLYHNAALEIEHSTITGLGIQCDGRSLQIRDTTIGGKPLGELEISPAVAWTADQNVYSLAALRIGNKAYTAASFADYQRATGQDLHSRWTLKPGE